MYSCSALLLLQVLWPNQAHSTDQEAEISFMTTLVVMVVRQASSSVPFPTSAVPAVVTRQMLEYAATQHVSILTLS